MHIPKVGEKKLKTNTGPKRNLSMLATKNPTKKSSPEKYVKAHAPAKKTKKADKKSVEGSPVIIKPNKKESDQIATADVFSLIKELHQKIDALQADVNHVKEKQALTQHFFQTSAAAVPASLNVFTTPPQA